MGGETVTGYDGLAVRQYLEELAPERRAHWERFSDRELSLVSVEQREASLRRYALEYLNSFELNTSDPQVLLIVATGARKIADHVGGGTLSEGFEGLMPLGKAQAITYSAAREAKKLAAHNSGSALEMYGGTYVADSLEKSMNLWRSRIGSKMEPLPNLVLTARSTAYTFCQLFAEANGEAV